MMRSKILHGLISLALTITLIAVVAKEISLSEFFAIFQRADLALIGVYGLLNLFSLFVRAVRYRLLLAAEHRPSFSAVIAVTAIRNAFVDFLPARLGEAVYIYFIHRLGVPVLTATYSFAGAIVLDFVVLGMLFGGTVATVYFGLWAGAAIVIAVLTALHLVWTWRKLNLPLWPLVGLTIVLRVAKYGGLVILLQAFIHQYGLGWRELPVVGVLSAFISAEAAASLPFSGIMGFGAYEGAWSAIFSTACVSPLCEKVPITTLSFVVHITTQLVGYGLGLIGLFWAFLLLRKQAGTGKTEGRG